MIRKCSFTIVIAVLVFTALSGSLNLHNETAYANTGEDLERDIDSYKQEQTEKEREAAKKEEELESIEEEIDDVKEEIKQLDDEVIETNEHITEKEAEVEETTARVEQLHEDIEELEERIAARDELLKERVKSMYQNGGNVNYLEVVLGAQSFGDLVERVSALNSIAQQDRAILEEHIEDMEALEIATEELENELASLENQMAELEVLKDQLEQQLDAKGVLIADLEAQGYEIEDNLLSIEEERELLKAQEEAAKQELAAWEEEQKRLEEERRKKEEEERRQREEAERQEAERKEAEKASQSSGSSSSNSTSSSSNNSSNETASSSNGGSATFHRPANGRVTSGFGSRTHPVYGTTRQHNGIDYGRDGGTGIFAAEAGTVVSARSMGGYGNTIIITHVIDGKTYATLYAHLASYNVSVGDRVSRGQNIATMGTTGTSTGVHLHFEVHPGGYSGGSSAVNPAPYLP
ncbi:peptidoglycan DD-metalloendopeptidase family protein [Salipaludibacillus agaradhaerens]|uniref:Peptidoglycan DD-metalloendopeptidase family protein n=1 Tax=Salipaludibacillus agaradhaerens TaxID=76935 RepID=A0A9Q4AYU5_SALAG|nr:peptidoglycan DD-metalloendopeptidase family protein [Salipaludibacillus agaradhaerens]MCR6095123.1 peptidoglycan DD-metalloendopeptidase family protein [Salipaludibacillus agaradhaerens]MCR6115319.1 peptidoglycan DD-metalloendopeptidase family protein [Salipaludibacillus agaradhaerens]